MSKFERRTSPFDSNPNYFHPKTQKQKCILCGNIPDKEESNGGYISFACECGEALSGLIKEEAVSNWNYLIDNRRDKLLRRITQKLGILDINEK